MNFYNSMNRLCKTKVHIIMLGETHVGKTSLVKRYDNDTFTLQHLTTLGVDFISKEVANTDTQLITAKIWDTAGQERFRTVAKSFYQQADGVLLVFDLTNEKSFDKLHCWTRSICEVANEGVVKYLVGNKVDLTEDRVIEQEEVMKVAAEYGMKYCETSAKRKINVTEVFEDIIKDAHEHRRRRGSKMLENLKAKSRACC
eukprot:TRINITY_DN3037_c0_g1_i19.p1 TRINITY_DN3037_c0_g1~~TRINITY_DN3037_c0_g1_i19.p1  ORF type:complete len:200 (+),score=38.87 TRINITY_DN3037_c0_g1_i19:189-788(+)